MKEIKQGNFLFNVPARRITGLSMRTKGEFESEQEYAQRWGAWWEKNCDNPEWNVFLITLKNEEILEAARKFLKSIGVSIEDKKVLLDEKDKRWQEAFELLKKEESWIKSLKLFADCEYKAVYFYPKDKVTLGGEYWVFVDKESGKVVSYLGAK